MTDYFNLAIGIGDDEAGGGPSPQHAQPVDYFSQATGIDSMGSKTRPAAANQEGLGEWMVNSIRGRQDPMEAGTGTVYDQHRGLLENPAGMAATLGASDAQMGDVVQSNLGDAFIRRDKDANDYDVFVTRGADGGEQRGYLNKPGLDLQDVTRGLRGALPYMATGGAAGALTRGAGLGVQALVQGGAAAATSAAGDIAQTPLGSTQGIDVGKAGAMAGFGAAGPFVGAAAGALWRRFVTVPGLIDKTTGQLTPRGIEAAKRAGVDPADVTPDFAKSFAKTLAETGNEAQAATQAGIDRFGIPATRGQITKDPYLLTQEESMRRRIYGEAAQDTMTGFDKRQAEAIRFAALGSDGSSASQANPYRGAGAPPQGIGDMINPARQSGASAFDRTPAALGEGAQYGLQAAKQGAKFEEAQLWKGVSDLKSTPAALATLPDKLNSVLAGETHLTPAAQKMGQALEAFASGDAPVATAGILRAGKTQSVDAMRRHLGDIVSDAVPGSSDARQAKMIYHAYNDWLEESAVGKLLDGDPVAAMNIVKARGFHREAMDVFRPKNADGSAAPAATRLKKIENADSGEAVIHALFGSQGSRGVAEGASQTLANFKYALERHAPKEAAGAWNDVRLAYWTRLVTGKNGELLGPTAIMNNIKAAQSGSRTVFNTLYTGAEQLKIRHFVRALEIVSYKPPNASGSGYTAASIAKDGVMKFLGAFGLDKPAAAALQYSGIGNALNSAAAKQAVSKIARPVRPNATPAIAAVAQPYARNALSSPDQSGSR